MISGLYPKRPLPVVRATETVRTPVTPFKLFSMEWTHEAHVMPTIYEEKHPTQPILTQLLERCIQVTNHYAYRNVHFLGRSREYAHLEGSHFYGRWIYQPSLMRSVIPEWRGKEEDDSTIWTV